MSMRRAVSNILDHYVEIVAKHEIIILCDGETLALAGALAKGVSERGATPILLALDDGLDVLPDLVARLLADDRIGMLVLASHEMWAAGLSAYLDLGSGGATLRSRCSPIFFDAVIPLPSMLRLYAANWQADTDYLLAMRANLPSVALCRVLAPGGTDLRFLAREWRTLDWEILTSPVEETVEGRIVADASVFLGKVNVPIELTIERGCIADMRCARQDDKVYRAYARHMEEAMREDCANRRLAEVGIGGNARAAISGIIMEDEAARGTCHFCFGDNTMLGGTNTSDWHGGTLVVRRPRFQEVA